MEISYGKTTTYDEIAKQLAEERDLKRISAKAIGGAAGRNEISVTVPCHRVAGTNDSVTGYAGDISIKAAFLKSESVNMDNLFIPAKKTAL